GLPHTTFRESHLRPLGHVTAKKNTASGCATRIEAGTSGVSNGQRCRSQRRRVPARGDPGLDPAAEPGTAPDPDGPAPAPALRASSPLMRLPSRAFIASLLETPSLARACARCDSTVRTLQRMRSAISRLL